jgi:hypothetical protein
MTNVNKIRDEMSQEYILNQPVPNINAPILRPSRVWETIKTAKNRRKKKKNKKRKTKGRRRDGSKRKQEKEFSKYKEKAYKKIS